MQLSVTRKELNDGLQIVSRAVSAHTSLPVLKNVLLETGTDSIKLSATDLELGIEVLIPANVQEPGGLTVHARTLLDIVAQLPEADVRMVAGDDQVLNIVCRRSEYRIQGLTAEDFPALPEVGSGVVVELSQPVLKKMIRQTALAASTEDTRPILTGVCFMVEGETLRLVATDTHRLAVRTAPVKQATGDAAVIVPVRSMNELPRMLGDDENGTVSIRIDVNQIMFHTPTSTLISRLIEGQYPRYERVIPESYNRRLTIPREEFQSSLRRARIVARDADSRDRVVLATTGENLVITAVSDQGRAHEEFEIAREGDEISIAFNVNFVLDVLGAIECEGVFLDLNDPLQPAVIRPIEDEDYLVVIMPMQVQ